MASLADDIRLSARRLNRSPGFAAVAILTLALAIGANTSILSLIDAALVRPLPYLNADQIVRIYSPSRLGRHSVSAPDFTDWHADNTVFSGMAAIDGNTMALIDRNGAEELDVALVTGDFFPVLGVRPAIGRALTAQDELPGTHVVVIGDALWRRRFAGDSSAVGQSVTLDGVPYLVIGVMPPAFDYPHGYGLWVPKAFSAHDLTTQRGAHYLDVIARLKPGATEEQARRQMATIWTRLATTYPSTNGTLGGEITSLRQSLVGDTRPALLVLWGAVVLVLLIACANVANLLLARALARRREVAVRAALGAARWQLVRESLVESLLLAFMGGVVGVALAGVGLPALLAVAARDQPVANVALDGRVLLATLGLTALTGVLFGLLPALQLADGGTRSTAGRNVQRAKRLLAVAEVALAVVLLSGAGLLVRSFAALRAVDPGFATDHRLTLNVSLPHVHYEKAEQRVAFYEAYLERLRAIPGVRDVATTMGLPFSGFRFSMSTYSLDGRHLSDDEHDRATTQIRVVSVDYFRTMGMTLQRGRAFMDTDRRGGQPVCMLNASAARLLFPGQDPIGHNATISTSFDLDGPRAGGTVIGIVADTRDNTLASPPDPHIFFSEAQFPLDFGAIVVETTTPPLEVEHAARAALAAVDPDVPMFDVRSMDDVAALSIARPRFVMTLLALFSAVAVLMAALGLYAVIAYTVGERTREIGIRVALGAREAHVLRLVVGGGLWLGGIGLVVGLAGALGATRLLRGLMYGVGPADGATFGATSILVLASACLATWLPARHAARVDPVTALRAE